MKPENRAAVREGVIKPCIEYCKVYNPAFIPMLEGVLEMNAADPKQEIPINTDVLFDFMTIAFAAGVRG